MNLIYKTTHNNPNTNGRSPHLQGKTVPQAEGVLPEIKDSCSTSEAFSKKKN